jgi:transposase
MKKYIVRLTDEERTQLNAMIAKGKSAAHKIRHAHVLLKADAAGPNWTDEQIAEAFSVHTKTVVGIRKRFVEEGFEEALKRKKQQRPSLLPKFDGQAEARLIALCCSEPPEGFARWTLRLLADKAVELQIVESVSYETVRRTLKKTNSSLTRAATG